MNKQHASPRFRFVAGAALLTGLALLVPALREGDPRLYLLAAICPVGMLISLCFFPRMFSIDRMVFSLTVYLSMIPVIMLAPLHPEEAISGSLRCVAGIGFLLAGASLSRFFTSSLLTGLLSGFLGLLALLIPFLDPVFPHAVAGAALVLLTVCVSAFLSIKDGTSALIPAFSGLVLILLQGNPAEAVVFYLLFSFLLWSAGNKTLWVFPLLGAALILPVFFSPSSLPFAQVSPSEPSSFSILHPGGSLYAFHESYGLIFSGLSFMLYLPLILRGMFIASVARSRFHAFLAKGCALWLAIRVMASLLCAFELLPVSFPFLPLMTASPTDFCAAFFALGLIGGISGRNEKDLAEDAHLAMLSR